jgi:hypothetical protein
LKSQALPTIREAACAFWNELPIEVRIAGNVLVFFPVFTKGVSIGLGLPDLDLRIPGIGIGGHRWAVTHSALAAYLGREGIRIINQYLKDVPGQDALRKLVSASGAGFCICVSLHLLKDALWDRDQTVRFTLPFLGGKGTLLGGTYIDDDAWLSINGLYAIKAASDILLLGFGKEIGEVRTLFQSYQANCEVQKAIREAGRASMEDASRLRKRLEKRIPTDPNSDPRFPQWIDEY